MKRDGSTHSGSEIDQGSEWIGLRGKIGGYLLNSPIRLLIDRLSGDVPSMIIARVAKHLTRPDSVLLDVGAGSGYYTVRIALELPLRRVIALDISEEMLAHLQRIAKRKGVEGKIEILRCPATRIDLPDHSVDLAIANTVLHELFDPARAINEMCRVLKPGGAIVVNDFLKKHGHKGKPVHGPIDAATMRKLFDHPELERIDVVKYGAFVVAEATKKN